tara:strand:- start:2074 stop:2469 length:396 start_codon:yes stop_codon:yes gene_type:complete
MTKKEYDKKRYLENREKERAQKKSYYLKNKEKIDDKQRLYKLANLDKVKAKEKKYSESMKDGLYTLYYLREEHYIGVTNSVKSRMSSHKSLGKHIEDLEVLYKYNTRREALDAEKLMHSIGYSGVNKNYKK